jgi:CheY-like chemotaxis protein
MSDWRILVIEDDPDGQEVVGRMLRHFKIPNDIVGNADEALEQLSHQNYTAAIVDLALPGMDGWTLLQTIHSHAETADLPCVAVTAFHSPELAVKAVKAGFTAYFPKPLEANSFVQELQRVLS